MDQENLIYHYKYIIIEDNIMYNIEYNMEKMVFYYLYLKIRYYYQNYNVNIEYV